MVQLNTIDIIVQSGLAAKIVLSVLLGSSIYSWGVILAKASRIKKARNNSQKFLRTFQRNGNLKELYSASKSNNSSPVIAVFHSGFQETQLLKEQSKDIPTSSQIECVSRALSRATMNEIGTLENGLGGLATIASAAPFVGLFGTVWGIMNSFQGIGATGSANLAVVAPGISEALITTAAGLAAAIPAVIAYNYFSNQIKIIALTLEGFNQDFLNKFQREANTETAE